MCFAVRNTDVRRACDPAIHKGPERVRGPGCNNTTDVHTTLHNNAHWRWNHFRSRPLISTWRLRFEEIREGWALRYGLSAFNLRSLPRLLLAHRTLRPIVSLCTVSTCERDIASSGCDAALLPRVDQNCRAPRHGTAFDCLRWGKDSSLDSTSPRKGF